MIAPYPAPVEAQMQRIRQPGGGRKSALATIAYLSPRKTCSVVEAEDCEGGLGHGWCWVIWPDSAAW